MLQLLGEHVVNRPEARISREPNRASLLLRERQAEACVFLVNRRMGYLGSHVCYLESTQGGEWEVLGGNRDTMLRCNSKGILALPFQVQRKVGGVNGKWHLGASQVKEMSRIC